MARSVTPITWRNVAAPDGTGALNALARSGENLGNSIGGFGDAIQEGANAYADRETESFIADLNAMGSDEERNAAVEAANQAFLQMDQVNTAVTDAENQDFRVNAEARDQGRYGFAVENQAATVEQRDYDKTRRFVQEEEDKLDSQIKGVQARLAVETEPDQIEKSKLDINRLTEQLIALRETNDFNEKNNPTRLEQGKVSLASSKDANTRANTLSREQTERFGNAMVEWGQSQDERTRVLGAERLVNTELAAASRITNTVDRYTHLNGIINNARANNLTINPIQQEEISKEINKASSRLTPTDIGVALPRYTTAFTSMASRPVLLPNGAPKLDQYNNPIMQDPTASEVSAFALTVAADIAAANPALDEKQVERLTKETMSELPNFSRVSRVAKLKDEILTGANKARVTEAVSSASWNARIDETPNRQGLQNLVREFIRTEGGPGFDATAIDDEDLNTDIGAIWDKIQTAMPEYKDPADIAKGVMRLLGSSHVDKSWVGYSDTQVKLNGESIDWDSIDVSSASERAALRDLILVK